MCDTDGNKHICLLDNCLIVGNLSANQFIHSLEEKEKIIVVYKFENCF